MFVLALNTVRINVMGAYIVQELDVWKYQKEQFMQNSVASNYWATYKNPTLWGLLNIGVDTELNPPCLITAQGNRSKLFMKKAGFDDRNINV